MDYLAIKHLHIGCVALSGGLFLLRGICMLRAPLLLQGRALRVLPHLVDTVLLGSAIIMIIWSGQYPFAQPWLGAKVLALLLYIGLGTIALKRGRTLGQRSVAFVAALATFGYLIAVAITRQVVPFV